MPSSRRRYGERHVNGSSSTHLARAVPPTQREPVASSRSVDVATDRFKGATKVIAMLHWGMGKQYQRGPSDDRGGIEKDVAT
jgi:hypothetical protein